MNHRLAWLVSGSLTLLALACSSTTADGGGDGDGGGNEEEVAACKSGCDKMKFFDCSSASEMAACYEDCGSASADQIEVFTACAESSICDPECRTSIQPEPSGGGNAPPKGEGATPDSCSSACDKLVSCSFVKVGDKEACVGLCQKEAYQFQIDCVNGNECSKLEKTCGAGATDEGPSGSSSSGGAEDPNEFVSAERCKSACQQSKLADCTDAAALTACQEKCTDAAIETRDTYSDCVDTSGSECTELADCYSQLR